MTTPSDSTPTTPVPRPEPSLSITVGQGRRLALVAVRGEVDIASAPELADTIERLAAVRRFRRIVIDLSGVTFIDLHGLRALDRARATLTTAGPSVELVPCAALMRLRAVLGGHMPFPGDGHPVAC